MNKSVLFIYTGGRSARIQGLQNSESPREFFYGYPFFKDLGLKVDFVETDNLRQLKLSIRYWQLRHLSKTLSQHFGVGSRGHMLLGLIDKINEYDVVIGTTDSISLGLCYLKKMGAIRANIVFLNMGLGNGIAKRNDDKTKVHSRIQEEVVAVLDHCQKVVSLGKPEHEYLLSVAPHLGSKLTFLPFGIDTDFWSPRGRDNKEGAGTVLSIGNDPNRDWDMALKVANICPETRFIFLTRRLQARQCPPNVELILGDMKRMQVSDVAVRALYGDADLVMVALKKTLQPSGQSVVLQSLACGTPVVMSKTCGLWDPSRFIDEETIDLVELGSPEAFQTKIQVNLSHPTRSLEIARRGRNLVHQEYSAKKFALSLLELCSD